MCQVVLDSSPFETTLRGSARGVSAPISKKCESRHGRRLHIFDGGGGNTRAIHGARPRCARASLRPSEIAPGDFVEPPAGVSLLCLQPNKKARTRRAFLFGGAGAIEQTAQLIDRSCFSKSGSRELPPKLPPTRRDAHLWDPGNLPIPAMLTSYRSDQTVWRAAATAYCADFRSRPVAVIRISSACVCFQSVFRSCLSDSSG